MDNRVGENYAQVKVKWYGGRYGKTNKNGGKNVGKCRENVNIF